MKPLQPPEDDSQTIDTYHCMLFFTIKSIFLLVTLGRFEPVTELSERLAFTSWPTGITELL